ncbi:MAG: hypothetical protein MAG453_00936 [Calditrichaeota bacterium]|nr:hypothetical protein [Calditrichota bacterium]
MRAKDRNLLTPEQLCEMLEVYLGRERGRAECHRLIDELKDDPHWRAEMDTLGATVRVFQKVESEKAPDDVCYRLMKVLNLADPGGGAP